MKPGWSGILVVGVVAVAAAVMAEEAAANNYLVMVEPTPPGVSSKDYHLAILAAAVGSEEKAKAAIVYNYKNVVSGFSARLTPPELETIKNQPQVNRVLPSATLQLMSSNFDGM